MRHKERHSRWLFVLIAAALAVSAAFAVFSTALSVLDTLDKSEKIDHSFGFESNGDLMASGSANFSDGVALLTVGEEEQSGSIFSKEPVDITSFRNSFTFRTLPGGSFDIGDGFCFAIQVDSPIARGAAGGGLGFVGLHGVCVKFDFYDNEGEGHSSTGVFSGTVSIPSEGSGDVLVNLTEFGIDLKSQRTFRVDMVYDGAILYMRIRDMSDSVSYTGSFDIDIPAKVGGRAYVGFTGSTGGATSVQEIQTWEFETG